MGEPAASNRSSKLAQTVTAAQNALAEGKTLPFSLISNPDIHSIDLNEIFKKSWQAVCPDVLVRQPGSIYLCKLGDVPVVLARDEDGILRGFVNVCRHRGYPVAQKDGVMRTLTCRYHGWTYRLDGKVHSVPEASQAEEANYKCLSLVPISVASWRGCIFAHLDPEASSLSASFDGLDDIAAECEFQLSDYRWLRRLDLDIPSNWKLVYDNVVECYHCPSMHARTLNTLYEASGFDDVSWQGRIRKVSAKLKQADELHHTIQLFPGTYLVMDPMVGIVGRFFPTECATTKLEFHFLAAPNASDEDAAHYAEMWCQTMHEDGEILAAQRPGVSTGLLDHGYLLAGPESSVVGVQQLILEAYTAALAEPDHILRGDGHAAIA